ncbi:MAG: GNAT family protein [Beijerinckiaceae bacterium]
MRVPDPLPMLRTRRLTLRRPAPRDVAARFRMGRDPEIYRMFGADVASLAPFTMENAEAWIARIDEHPCAWVIAVEEDAIGEVRIDSPVDADARASLAIGILDRNRIDAGYGAEAIRAAAAFAFDTLQLHRLSVRVLAFNARAIRAYEKVGFRREGVERQSARVGGEWHDDVMMGLLADELR